MNLKEHGRLSMALAANLLKNSRYNDVKGDEYIGKATIC